MNWRIKEILIQLNQLGKKTINELANNFNVSERTIRNDLHIIEKFMIDHELMVPLLGLNGVIEPGEDISQALELIQKEDFYSYKLSKQERIQLITLFLIDAKNYITIQRLSTILCVSRATVMKDLEQVKTDMLDEGLQITTYSNKGLFVSGTEKNKRLYLLYGNSKRKRSLNLTQYRSMGKQYFPESGLLMDYDCDIIQKIISEQESSCGTILTDEGFDKLESYLEIMLHRKLAGYTVEKENTTDKIDPLADSVYGLICRYFNLQPEIGELMLLNHIVKELPISRKFSENGNIVSIQCITRQFIEIISKEINKELSNDFDFYENLSNHLYSVLEEDSIYQESSPFVEDIVKKNPDILKAVENNIGIYEDNIRRRLTDTDISYIVVHICAAIERRQNSLQCLKVKLVCNSGIGTSRLLQERLRKHYRFQTIEVCSSHSVISNSENEIIISTVPLRQPNLEYILVSPFLTDEDYIRIGERIEQTNTVITAQDTLPVSRRAVLMNEISRLLRADTSTMPEKLASIEGILAQFFHEENDMRATLPVLLPTERIILEADCQNWTEATKLSAELLLRDHVIEERYINAVFEAAQTSKNCFIIHEGFVLPHSGLGTGSLKPGFSLVRLKKPVPFQDNKEIMVRYFCCMSASDKESHLRALFSLGSLLEDPVYFERIEKASSPEKITDILCEFEYKVKV